jgi:hypothetical protein
VKNQHLTQAEIDEMFVDAMEHWRRRDAREALWRSLFERAEQHDTETKLGDGK